MTGTLELEGTVSGLPEGETRVQLAWTLNATSSFPSFNGLAAGDNSFPVPTGVKLLLLIPPRANGTAIFVKPAGATTGYAIDPATPSILGNADTTLVLNAAAIVPDFRLLMF